jgi:signal transduction histidine kinase
MSPASAPRRGTRLVGRLLAVQVLVIGVGSLTLAVTAALVAPGLFRHHLSLSGEDAPQVREHAQQAFGNAFAISLAVALLASLLAAGLVSWFLVGRVSRPVEDLADAVETIAGGRFDVRVPSGGFSTEIDRLSTAVGSMAGQLAATEMTRSRLLADLAHELRTPLATLEAYVDGIEDGVVPTEPESWQTMRDQIARLRRLASDLRDVAAAAEQALTVSPEELAVEDLAEAALAAAAPRYAAKGVELRRVSEGVAPPVVGDRERLEQVLANLLDNALRHTSPGGHVVVTTESLAAVRGPDGTRSPERAVICVTDDGEGIPPDQVDAVFERFYRAEPARTHTDGGGSGLGLTIARALADAHGGTLTAHSAGPGRGSTLRLALPIARPHAHTGRTASAR